MSRPPSRARSITPASVTERTHALSHCVQRSPRSRGERRSDPRWHSGLLGFCLACAGALAGCSHSAPQLAPAAARATPVSHPVGRVVTDYVDFTGRTDAVQLVFDSSSENFRRKSFGDGPGSQPERNSWCHVGEFIPLE